MAIRSRSDHVTLVIYSYGHSLMFCLTVLAIVM
jgi:hypothetical protein